MKRHLWTFLLPFYFLSASSLANNSHVPDDSPAPTDEVDLKIPQSSQPEGTVSSPNPGPSRQAILEKFSGGEVKPAERSELARLYLEAIKEFSPGDRKKAVAEFFEASQSPFEDESFFDAMKGLAENLKKSLEQDILELPPERTLGLLSQLSRPGQIQGFDRALVEARKKPALISTLAAQAEKAGFEFSRKDLNQFIFENKKYHPELLRQYSRNNPEGVSRLLDTFKKGGPTSDEAFSFVSLAIRNGDISLHAGQQKELRDYVLQGQLSPRSREEAFRALKAGAPQLAAELLAGLTRSSDPIDQFTAASFYGNENPKTLELLNQAFREADSKTLALIVERFPGFVPELKDYSSERLKALAEWGTTEKVGTVVEASLRELFSKSVSTQEVLPLIQAGLERVPKGVLRALDSIDGKKAKSFEAVSTLAMKKVLESLNEPATTSLIGPLGGIDFLMHFPKAIEAQAEALEKEVSGLWGDSVMRLLGGTQNPKRLETYLAHMNDSKELTSFAASEALGKLLAAKPGLVTPGVEERLRKVLAAKDENDVARLHLRQHLPEALMLKLDQQILEGQERDPERSAAVLKKTTEAALEILKKEEIGLMGPGQRGLALEFLIRSGHKEAPKLVDEYLRTAFPKGYIHNVNAIQRVIRAAKQAGIPINPEILKSVQARIEREGRVLWDSGKPKMRKESQGSNVIPFSAAAYIVGAADTSQLNETQKEILETLRKMRGQSMPYFFPTEDEPKESGALLDKAPTSGRAVTAGLAIYLTASKSEKAEAARALLGATRTFLQHFSQTHEIPRASDRTHNRTPGSQQMAPYYGFTADGYVKEALTLLSQDPTLSEQERLEAFNMISEHQTRLLALTENDGGVYRRAAESFPNENLVYQLLTGLVFVQERDRNVLPTKR